MVITHYPRVEIGEQTRGVLQISGVPCWTTFLWEAEPNQVPSVLSVKAVPACQEGASIFAIDVLHPNHKFAKLELTVSIWVGSDFPADPVLARAIHGARGDGRDFHPIMREYSGHQLYWIELTGYL